MAVYKTLQMPATLFENAPDSVTKTPVLVIRINTGSLTPVAVARCADTTTANTVAAALQAAEAE
jgi:hypothetical protein